MGLGGSGGLDGADVDGSGRGSVGRQVVQFDGQGLDAAEPAESFRTSEGQRRGGGRRSRNDEGVRASPGSQSGKALAVAAGGELSSAGDSAEVDYQAGEQGA